MGNKVSGYFLKRIRWGLNTRRIVVVFGRNIGRMILAVFQLLVKFNGNCVSIRRLVLEHSPVELFQAHATVTLGFCGFVHQ